MREANPNRYLLVPFHAYEEGDYVGMKALIIRTSSKEDALEALDSEIIEGSEELWGARVNGDVFGGSSPERAGDGLYYVAGFDPEAEDETATLVLKVYETQMFDTLDEAEEAALRKYNVYTPLVYRYDDRGALQPVKRGSKSTETKQLRNKLLR